MGIRSFRWYVCSFFSVLGCLTVEIAVSSSFRLRIILALAAIAWSCIGGLLFYRRWYAPVRRLFDRMDQESITKERAETQLPLDEKYPSAAYAAEAVNRYVEGAVRENTAEIFNKQTELLALQSQINPHFLFNTLDSIRGEAYLHDDDEVADMLENLASFFRYSISKTGTTVRLRDEINNVQNYMKIQEHRFRGRFHLEINMDDEDKDALNCYVPKLILQPVVENSIYHGLEDMKSGGVIELSLARADDMLIVTVSDNGKGMSLETLKNLNDRIHDTRMQLETGKEESQRNTGIALPNVHKRIQLLYGKKYGLDVYSSLGQGTEVEILLPCIKIKGVDTTDGRRGTENQ